MSDYELKDLTLKIVDNDFAKSFISRFHYSKTCSNIVVAIGEFVGIDMKNCIVFNYCAGREMAKQVMVDGDNTNTLELARMVSLEPKPKNLESYCISKALNWIKQNMPNIKVVISYADNTAGHHGYCYQASGFTYYGQSRPTKEHYLDGKIKIISKVKIPVISVCEDVDEHYNYWKEHFNPKRNDCCNLRGSNNEELTIKSNRVAEQRSLFDE